MQGRSEMRPNEARRSITAARIAMLYSASLAICSLSPCGEMLDMAHLAEAAFGAEVRLVGAQPRTSSCWAPRSSFSADDRGWRSSEPLLAPSPRRTARGASDQPAAQRSGAGRATRPVRSRARRRGRLAAPSGLQLPEDRRSPGGGLSRAARSAQSPAKWRECPSPTSRPSGATSPASSTSWSAICGSPWRRSTSPRPASARASPMLCSAATSAGRGSWASTPRRSIGTRRSRGRAPDAGFSEPEIVDAVEELMRAHATLKAEGRS